MKCVVGVVVFVYLVFVCVISVGWKFIVFVLLVGFNVWCVVEWRKCVVLN